MAHFPSWKVVLIVLVCLLGVLIASPNFLSQKTMDNLPNWYPDKKMNLGLDLRGGVHLLMEVDFPAYLNDQLENLKDNLRKELRSEKIGYTNLSIQQDKITINIRDQAQIEKATSLIQKDKDLEVLSAGEKLTVFYNEDYLKNMRSKLVDQSREIIRRRVDENGTKEPIIQKQGEDKILLQVPGLDDPEHLKSLVGQTAKMSFHLVNENVSANDHIPFNTMLLETDTGDKLEKPHKVAVYKKIMLNGDLLSDAMVIFENSKPAVGFAFNSLGAKLFADLTKNNIGKRLAIVLDNKLICAPTISVAIMGGSGHIIGNYTAQSATDLALLLRAGALPTPLKIIEERTVGPSLGAVSIAEGKLASIISVVAVAVFMLAIYGMFGAFANIALCFNLIFLVALLSMLQATLTLPGIAGIILTMGMSVDANVLIFERIREENKNGISAASSVERGFNQAFNTIIDSNLTTILVGIFLYAFGTGAVKGFAVTLVLGIATSMFSAITLTRLMMSKWMHSTRPKNLV